MKKATALILASLMLTLAFSLTGCGNNNDNPVGPMGGWSLDEIVKCPLPADVQDVFEYAVSTAMGATYEPIALVASQATSGVNYAILCKSTVVVPNAVPELKIVVASESADGTFSLVSINDFNLADYTQNFSEEGNTPTVGGWDCSIGAQADLTGDVKNAFYGAKENMVGSTIVPLAMIGTQVVNGINYAFICKVTPVTPDAASKLEVIIVNVGPGGTNPAITSVYQLNLGKIIK